jgi:hypothetical protein
MTLLVACLLACSDYDLDAKSDDGGPTRRDDSAPPVTDTSEDTSPSTDSGADTQPDDPPVDVPDGKIDVALVIDVAYVYDCYHADIALHTDALVAALLGSGANVTVSVSTFDDYQVSGEWWAGTSGKPFVMRQQQTTDLARLQSAASGLALEWGGDGPGSGYEAIAQVADGDGFDQDCDGAYDGGTDVKPFKSRSSDAFRGAVSGTENSGTPGTGSRAGVGWRDGSKRIVVVLAENSFRDREESHETPTGSCSAVATRAPTIDALNAIDAKFLGVNAYEFQDIDPLLQEQLEALARGTTSKIDADGDGAHDDTAVLSGSWDWPETTVLMSAIFDLAR